MNLAANLNAGRPPAQPIRPSLQALHAACSPPTLADALDELEQVIALFSADLGQFVERVSPLLHPVEDDLVQSRLTESDLETAPAVCRVQDARRQLNAMHDQLFEIASRIAL